MSAPALPAPLAAAIAGTRRDQAGILPPFLSRPQLDACLAAWERLYAHPDMAWCQTPPRYLMGPAMYLEPAFAEVATHPVILATMRAVLATDDIRLASYHVVATPSYADHPSDVRECNEHFHVDHVIYSDVPVANSPDNVFACAWINFEELALENGPLCLAVGTDKFNLGWEFFRDPLRARLTVADMNWGRLIQLNVGPPGTTGIYSGKTWHTATNNCSGRIRKGLQLMFNPAQPKTAIRRIWFDAAGLDPVRHARFRELIAGRVPTPDHDPAQQQIFEAQMPKERATELAQRARFARPIPG